LKATARRSAASQKPALLFDRLCACSDGGKRLASEIERFNSHLKGSFAAPLVAKLKAGGLKLDADIANRESATAECVPSRNFVSGCLISDGIEILLQSSSQNSSYKNKQDCKSICVQPSCIG
jgi:hypothetical protein